MSDEQGDPGELPAFVAMNPAGVERLRRMADLQVLAIADRWRVVFDAVCVRCAGVDCPALRDLVRLRDVEVLDPANDLFREALVELGAPLGVPIDAVRRQARSAAQAVLNGDLEPRDGFLTILGVCDAIVDDLPAELSEFEQDSTLWIEARANRKTQPDADVERAGFVASAERVLREVPVVSPGVDQRGEVLSPALQSLVDQHCLGLVGGPNSPWTARRALADGIRSPALERLASLDRIDYDARNRPGQLVRRALVELGMPASDPAEAVLRLASEVAADIIARRVSPIEGADEIVRMDSGGPQPSDPLIHPFIYVWAEWGERPPDHLPGFERMVFDGAEALVDHVREHGPRSTLEET